MREKIDPSISSKKKRALISKKLAELRSNKLKKSNQTVAIIGSGLAGTSAAMELLDRGFKVYLITSDTNPYLEDYKKNGTVINARQKTRDHAINSEYQRKNQVICQNFSLVGSLEKGGLSNIWAGVILFESQFIRNSKTIIDEDYFKKKFYFQKSENATKDSRQNDLLKFFKDKVCGKIKFLQPTGLYSKKTKKIFSSLEDLSLLEKNSNFCLFENIFVQKIKKKKNGKLKLSTSNNRLQRYEFDKLILATGTISSTKLLLDYLNIKEEFIRLRHNPNLAIIGLLKKKFNYIGDKELKSVATYIINPENSSEYPSVGSIGFFDEPIEREVSKNYSFIPSLLIKIIARILRGRLFIANCFIPVEFSDSYLKLEKDNVIIQGGLSEKYREYEKKIKHGLRKSFSRISYLLIFKRMPIGSDIHYTGTVTEKNHPLLKVEENFSLSQDKNIFVIDGSIIESNPIFPGAYIINNAIKLGKTLPK